MKILLLKFLAKIVNNDRIFTFLLEVRIHIATDSIQNNSVSWLPGEWDAMLKRSC